MLPEPHRVPVRCCQLFASRIEEEAAQTSAAAAQRYAPFPFIGATLPAESYQIEDQYDTPVSVNVIGTSMFDATPGLKRHLRNVSMVALSKIALPVLCNMRASTTPPEATFTLS